MKFIEIETEEFDDDTDTEIKFTQLITLDSINIIQLRKHGNGSERKDVVYIKYRGGGSSWCFNYSYQELKRILTSASNIIKTGGNV